MSTKSSSEKIENKLVSTGNGQVVMSSGHNTTTDKSKVDFIYGAVPSRSKTDILLVLQSCDYNVEAAISIFSQGQAEEVLSQWSHKGYKDGNKRKRNKKKQANKESKEVPGQTKPDSEDKKHSTTSNASDNNTTQAVNVPASKNPVPLSLNLPSDSEKSSTVEVNSVFSSTSGKSAKSSHDVEHGKSSPTLKAEASSSSSHPKHHKPHPSKPEKLSPTSNTDALKRTTKDLTRSSFSLARYQVVLEEECDQSFKRINKTFENIKNCIREREETLIQDLKEFKEQSVNLLQQRSEDAAALKLKTERVHSMPGEQVVFLRADIKSFVAERKIDEELAQTKRFVCDEEKLLQELKTFGQVLPIKSVYTPVVLNHPTTTPTVKSTSTNITPTSQSKSLVTKDSSSKKSADKSSTNLPTASVTNTTTTAQATKSATVKSSSNQESSVNVKTSPAITKESSALGKSKQTNEDKQPTSKAPESSTIKLAGATGPPLKISTLISLAMAKSSAVASDGLKGAGEASKQQGASSTSEQKRGGRNQPKDSSRNQQNRPNTAPAQQAKQQRTREPRAKRPQTNRLPRQNRHAQEEKVGSQTGEDTANQGVGLGESESSEQNPKQVSQSEQPKDGGGRRRPRRRSGRDRRPRANGGETNVAKDNTESDQTKKTADFGSVQQENVKDEESAMKDGHIEDAIDNVENRQPSEEADVMNAEPSGEALPQRSQNRRRNRNADEKKEKNINDINGSTNGMNHDDPNEKEEKESPIKENEKEMVSPKTTHVEAPALINGHEISTNESKAIELEKSHPEVNGYEGTNGTSDDCLVER